MDAGKGKDVTIEVAWAVRAAPGAREASASKAVLAGDASGAEACQKATGLSV
jgi:hypothetical protein